MSRNALLSVESCVTSRKTAAKDTNIDAQEENFSVTKHALLLVNTVFGGICKKIRIHYDFTCFDISFIYRFLLFFLSRVKTSKLSLVLRQVR